MLTTMLNSHPQLKCYAEESVNTLPIINDKEGINVKYPHLQPGEIIKYANEYKIIHLIRTNIFHTAISNFINDNKTLTKTPTAHIFSENKNLYYLTDYNQNKHDKQVSLSNKKYHKDIEKDKIDINVNDIKMYMYFIHQQIHSQLQLLKNHSNVLTLTYEQITSNDTDVKQLNNTICNDICNFLNVDFHNMYPTTMKVNNSNYEKYISNWDELKQIKQIKELNVEYI